MPGTGKWNLQAKYRRCTGARTCHACAANPPKPPHGPYYELRRRNPATGRQESVYLGNQGLSAEELERVNQVFSGKFRPTKQEILAQIVG
jgi:hypothetical protein